MIAFKIWPRQLSRLFKHQQVGENDPKIRAKTYIDQNLAFIEYICSISDCSLCQCLQNNVNLNSLWSWISPLICIGSRAVNFLTVRLVIQLQQQSLLYCLAYYILQDMQPEQVEESEKQQQTEGRWDPDQHLKFLQALMAHGKNWKTIQTVVQTRTTAQVRSHAQKFFLKLLKIEKERKKNLKKGITEPSKPDLELTKTLLEQTISANTPTEILHFLRREPLAPPAPVQDQPPSLPPKQNQILRHGTSQILEQVLEANQETSFLMALFRHNNGFQDPEQTLVGMIAFPQIHKEEKEEEETANKRKKSFSLYEQQENEERYYCVVKKMRGE